MVVGLTNRECAWLHATVAPELLAHAALTADSRAVRPGDVFFALPGATYDGRNHLQQAVDQGACAILWESNDFAWPKQIQTPNLAVTNLKSAMGFIASAWWNFPSSRLTVYAFTGTSGKTSCSTWASQLLTQLGQPCAVIGTRGAGTSSAGGEATTVDVGLTEVGLTTPQALPMQQWLAQFADRKISSVALEASSIGLQEGRLNGTKIATAIFTNLSRDHLDYHGSMEQYAGAKAQLFSWDGLQTAVVNIDDEMAPKMLEQLNSTVNQIWISTNTISTPRNSVARSKGTIKVVFASDIEFTSTGVNFNLDGSFGVAPVQAQVAGLFNVSNLLSVAACALSQGFSVGQVAEELSKLQPVEGRMQIFGGNGLPMIVVDYAHKPDALEKVLVALRLQAKTTQGLLWCVVGCGGDRDQGKRPLMGAIAEQLADRVVVTSDNPRSESPELIAKQVLNGMKSNDAFVELDRAKAIEFALSNARSNDVVLVAGKGHETYQEVMGVKRPFSDIEFVKHWVSLSHQGRAH